MRFSRAAAKHIKEMANQYPVVSVVGPRQAGKTTLTRALFPDKPYVNLEDPDVREFAINDTKGFINQFPDGVIIDEVQHVPKLLSYIQVIVDGKKINGMFILTGSQQLDLSEAISQSLAGRTALVTLLPLTVNELAEQQVDLDLNAYLLRGFLPRTYVENMDTRSAYRNYVSTYLERDLRKVTNVHDLLLFQKFMRLCASRVSQVLNHESLANEVGVSSGTVRNWLSILEASYIVFRIPPYFENFGKRIIKSPKLYFFDVGLVSYLLDIETETQMARDPLHGNLVENLVVLELIKSRLNQGLEPNLYFYRDNHQNEVDIVYKRASELIPVEIKSAQSASHSFTKGLRYFKQLAGNRVPAGWVVYAGEHAYQLDGFNLINFKQASQIVE